MKNKPADARESGELGRVMGIEIGGASYVDSQGKEIKRLTDEELDRDLAKTPRPSQ